MSKLKSFGVAPTSPIITGIILERAPFQLNFSFSLEGRTSVTGGAICSSGGEIAPPVNMLSESLGFSDDAVPRFLQISLRHESRDKYVIHISKTAFKKKMLY